MQMDCKTWEQNAISWYDAHSQQFADSIKNADPSQDLQHFLSTISKDEPILDAGCGTGRDLEAMSRQGYDVHGLEPSKVLAKRAQGFSAHPIITTPLSQGIGTSLWGGIWCMGVFVHIPLSQWQNHLRLLVDGLKPAGVLHCHTKMGSGESVDSRGRPLCMMSADQFMSCARLIDCQSLDIRSQSVLDHTGKAIDWMCLSIVK